MVLGKGRMEPGGVAGAIPVLYHASAEPPSTLEEKNMVASKGLHQLATRLGRLSFSTRTDLGDYVTSRIGWETCQLDRCLANFTLAFSWMCRRR